MGQWHQRDPFFQRNGMVTGIYDPQMFQIKILYGNVHGFGDFRGFTEFDFNAVSFTVMKKKQVQFRTAVS
jgi:hypothetical protein